MTNGQTTNGGQGAIVAVLVIITLLILGGILYLAGVFGPRERVVEVETPEVEAPAVPEPDQPQRPTPDYD